MSIKLKGALLALAALGTFTAVSATQVQSVSATTYAKVVSNRTLTMNPDDRNANFTGSSALYTKAGTLKGAQLVASKSTLKNEASINTSKNNVRAYRIAKTNRGSFYYKVVTFDGKYRGWIYGGRQTSDFGGGLKGYNTFKSAALNPDQTSGTFKITNVGTANDGRTVTYQQPAWTQYKIGRQITDSTPYKDATFKVDQAGTRSREGDQWVHIVATDNKYSAANGWIQYAGLTKTAATTTSSTSSTSSKPVASNNAVQISLVDSATNSTVKTFSYTNANAVNGNTLGTYAYGVWSLDTNVVNDIQAQIKNALAGTNYQLANNTLTADQQVSLAQAKFGSSITLNVIAIPKTIVTVDSQLIPYGVNQNTTYNWWDVAHLFKIQDKSVSPLTPVKVSSDSLKSNSPTADAMDTTAVNFEWVWSPIQYDTFGDWIKNIKILGFNVGEKINETVKQLIGNNLPVSIPKHNLTYTAGELYTKSLSKDKTSQDYQDLQNIFHSFDGFKLFGVTPFHLNIDGINEAYRHAVDGKYLTDGTNMTYQGEKGKTFTSSDIMSQINGNPSYKTLKSPWYPVFTSLGNGSYKLDFKQIVYTAQSTDSGTYGQPVRVIYSYDNNISK